MVKVVTRPRTMSGRRGGLVLSLEPAEARKWIEDRWADPFEPAQPTPAQQPADQRVVKAAKG